MSNAIIDSVAAATLTGYLVGFYKKAYPTALDRSIVAVAVVAGLLSALVATMASGGVHLSQASLGTILMQGLSAAGLSAGVQVVNKPPASMT